MELKLIEDNLKELFGNQPVNIALTMAMIETYGQSQWNAALDKAEEVYNEKCGCGTTDGCDMDKQSILSLKVPE
jgi:hypothetical protein